MVSAANLLLPGTAGNNPCTDNNDYLKNVCEKDKCLKCLKADKNNGDKKWNTCYNEIALKETNLLRKDYKAKDLKTLELLVLL